MKEEHTCGICLGPRPTQTPCGHYYHKECLFKFWTQYKQDYRCPTCSRTPEEAIEFSMEKQNNLLCTLIVQKNFRMFLQKKRFQKKILGITKIQAVWKAKKVRTQYNEQIYKAKKTSAFRLTSLKKRGLRRIRECFSKLSHYPNYLRLIEHMKKRTWNLRKIDVDIDTPDNCRYFNRFERKKRFRNQDWVQRDMYRFRKLEKKRRLEKEYNDIFDNLVFFYKINCNIHRKILKYIKDSKNVNYYTSSIILLKYYIDDSIIKFDKKTRLLSRKYWKETRKELILLEKDIYEFLDKCRRIQKYGMRELKYTKYFFDKKTHAELNENEDELIMPSYPKIYVKKTKKKQTKYLVTFSKHVFKTPRFNVRFKMFYSSRE